MATAPAPAHFPVRLWDFGAAQYMQHLETGEIACTCGVAPDVQGGPFDLLDHEGSTYAVARGGNDEDKVLLSVATEIFSFYVVEERREGCPGPGRRMLRCGVQPERPTAAIEWLDEARIGSASPKALRLPLPGAGHFECEVYVKRAGIPAGIALYSLWWSMPWVLSHVFGAYTYQWVKRRRPGWQKILVKMGLSADHLRYSSKALGTRVRIPTSSQRDLRRPASGSGLRSFDCAKAETMEFSVTTPGLLCLLAAWTRQKWARSEFEGKEAKGEGESEDLRKKVAPLLAALVHKVCDGRTLDFPDFDEQVSGKVTNGNVAPSAPASSQQRGRKTRTLSRSAPDITSVGALLSHARSPPSLCRFCFASFGSVLLFHACALCPIQLSCIALLSFALRIRMREDVVE